MDVYPYKLSSSVYRQSSLCAGFLQYCQRWPVGMPLLVWRNSACLLLTRRQRVPSSLVWPMIPRPSVTCFENLSSFYPAVFIFLTTLYTMLVLDFRLTALVLLFLPLIFLLVNLYRKKSVKIIEKPSSCRISIVSWRISGGLSGALIKREAPAGRIWWNQPRTLDYANRSRSLGCPLFASCRQVCWKLLSYAVWWLYFEVTVVCLSG